MKLPCKSLLFLILCCFLFSSSFSQDIENDSLRETRFIARVKDISEFFERFNDEKNSEIRTYLKQKNLDSKLTRSLLLKSLFNNHNTRWQDPDVLQFVKKITDATHPQYIDFVKGDWFAEVTCNFIYKNHLIKIPLILKTRYDGSNNSVKWVIESVKWAGYRNGTVPDTTYKKDKFYFIPPSNQSTKFAKLLNVFQNKKHLINYVDIGFFKGKGSASFFIAVQNGELHFTSVRGIKYHFLQINNWLFTVDDDENNSNNSGWLISSLKKISGRQKLSYIKDLLNR